MSQLRTANAGDRTAFPGSTFVIDETPPITQCQEAQISEINASFVSGQVTITKVGAFVGIDLTGKTVTVSGTVQDNGTFNILSNVDDVITTDHTWFGNDNFATITVQDPGEAYLTRNESSFTRFIENESRAHTTKGGQLFTDTPSPPMNNACSDTFDPI